VETGYSTVIRGLTEKDYNKTNIHKIAQFLQVKGIPTKWKVIAVAVTVVFVTTGVIVISQLTNILSPSNPSTNASPTPTQTVLSEKFVVTTVIASPSNATPGLVTVIAEVRNDGLRNETVLVIMQIQEPNGDIMSIANNSSPLEIPAGESKTITFEPHLPLNVKIGKFNVGIDVYDLNQITKYYSTGFIYPFTTPIAFYIYLHTREAAYTQQFYMVVDGITYYTEGKTFYWYLGTAHTITVPQKTVTNSAYGYQFYSWGDTPEEPEDNTRQLTVTANSTTTISIVYVPYFT